MASQQAVFVTGYRCCCRYDIDGMPEHFCPVHKRLWARVLAGDEVTLEEENALLREQNPELFGA